MKKGFIKFFLFFTVTAAVLCGCGGEGKTAFTVNEVAVSREELVFYMRRLSDTVIAQIEEKYELSAEDKEFWEKPIGNTTPLELLRDTAQKEIVRSKILFLEAEKCGDKLPLTYSEQQTAWKKDNDERLRSEQAGKTVYGVTLRSFYTYLSLLTSDAENRLKAEFEKNGTIGASEQEIKAYYSAHPEYFSGESSGLDDNKQSIRSRILNEKFENYLNGLAEKSEIKYIDMKVNTDLLD